MRVPRDAPTIQAGVDAAAPGGLVLIAPGVYEEQVTVTTPYLTIRGKNRNTTIIDGDFELANGIQVIEADGVVDREPHRAQLPAERLLLESACHGYRGSYLTAYNNGDYGIFAFDSVWGQFDHSYASGSPDSGFYIGQCAPCHAVITDVSRRHNALGVLGDERRR